MSTADLLYWAYQALFPLVGLIVLLRLAFVGRGRTLREGRAQLAQRLGRPSQGTLSPLSGGPVLWVHAASVGESGAAAPLLAALQGAGLPWRVLFTTTTAAGLERARSLPGVSAAVLAPLDLSPAVKAFLDRARPGRLLLLETELWPAMLGAALARGIPVAVANGRMTERSFRRYRWARPLLAPLLARVSRAAVQTEEDAARFEALGVPRGALKAVGNMKYDIAPPQESEVVSARARLGRLGWEGDPVLTAGSTRPGEEEAVLQAFSLLKRRHRRLRLVLAPRHIERSDEVARLLAARGLSFARYSQPESPSGADCLLLDRLVLAPFYCVCDAAFVGGTLAQEGGHNIAEPALAGRPVLYGPHLDSVQGAARALEEACAGFVVEDASELAAALMALLEDRGRAAMIGAKARGAALGLAGAARRAVDFLGPFLRP